MRVMTQSLPSGEATFLAQHSVTPQPRVRLLHLPTRKRVITGRENERSRVRGLGQPDASVALGAAKESMMRTLRPASPGPADAPRPRLRLWPGVAGSEHGLCPAPQAAAGSPRFGPSDPFTTRVTRNVLVGSGPRVKVCEVGLGAVLGPVGFGVCTSRRGGSLLRLSRPQLDPSLVLLLSYVCFLLSSRASPPTLLPFLHFLGEVDENLEQKSGDLSFHVRSVTS